MGGPWLWAEDVADVTDADFLTNCHVWHFVTRR